jgi:hypothetical protein
VNASSPSADQHAPTPNSIPTNPDFPQPGRPSSFTESKITAICALIRNTGMSDTAAGALAEVKRSTLSRWKKNEEVKLEFDQARAQYLIPRLQRIGETRLKDGRPDWRAQAWLVKFAAPEVHGRPSSRRKLRDVELPKAVERQASPIVGDPTSRPENITFGFETLTSSHESPTTPCSEILEIDSARMAASPPPWPPCTPCDALRENVTFRPETDPSSPALPTKPCSKILETHPSRLTSSPATLGSVSREPCRKIPENVPSKIDHPFQIRTPATFTSSYQFPAPCDASRENVAFRPINSPPPSETPEIGHVPPPVAASVHSVDPVFPSPEPPRRSRYEIRAHAGWSEKPPVATDERFLLSRNKPSPEIPENTRERSIYLLNL